MSYAGDAEHAKAKPWTPSQRSTLRGPELGAGLSIAIAWLAPDLVPSLCAARWPVSP